MKKLRPFELALVVIFALLALFALFLLTTYKGDPDSDAVLARAIGEVEIWGTLPADGIEDVLRQLTESNEAYRNITYQYIHRDDFDTELVTALADSVGPDLILISQEKLVDMRRRIQPISYETLPLRDVKDTYVDGAHIFAMSDGVYGYPIAIDPLMMYWNRNLLSSAGYLEAPRTWEQLVNNVLPDLIERDFDRTLRRSVVAMGEYDNVRNAFGLISTLLLQSGSQMVEQNSNGTYQVKLQSSSGQNSNPLRTTADFYTRFSKPNNALYSWNRSFAEDRQQFTSEDLVLYFGFGSEGEQIAKINPNLNFDIAEVPQGETASVRRTYGRVYALSLLKSSDNQSGAFSIMQNFGSAQIADRIASASNMAPVSRSSVSKGSDDVYGRLSYQSAGIALGWLNPELEASNRIFSDMTKNINENRTDLQQATIDVSTKLRNEF